MTVSVHESQQHRLLGLGLALHASAVARGQFLHLHDRQRAACTPSILVVKFHPHAQDRRLSAR